MVKRHTGGSAAGACAVRIVNITLVIAAPYIVVIVVVVADAEAAPACPIARVFDTHNI